MHVFLSPHFGDAVLNCGGAIHRLAQAGQSVVARIVMGQKFDARQAVPTPIVQEMHRRWGGQEPIMASRSDEDEQALRLLGAASQRMTVWPEAIYRTSRRGEALYPTREALFGDPHPDDLAANLIPTIALPPGDPVRVLYAPLGVGNHVDHQIVRNWALVLKKHNPGLKVKLYAEFPYAEDTRALHNAMLFYRSLGLALRAERVFLSEADARARIDATTRCHTQISLFWGSAGAAAKSIHQALLRAGEGQPAEVYWCVPD